MINQCEYINYAKLKVFRLLPYFILLLCLHANAQKIPILKLDRSEFFSISKKLLNDKTVSADSVLHVLENWNKYQTINKVNQSYIFYYDDPYFGKIPMRIFIPSSYNNKIKTPLILLLHGAVKVSSFDRANDLINNISKPSEADVDFFFDYLSKQDYIILIPFADPEKRFDWVMNSFGNPMLNSGNTAPNKTYHTLVKVVLQLKQTLNIDDSKIFAFGHSDGGDGAFCMELFQPTIFAGFLVYNSMLTNFYDNIYLANLQNRQLYIVHSDLDDIRPIQQTSKIIDFMKTQYPTISYKVYKGYKHFDKHLTIDLPFANKFILSTERNPFPGNVYWESSNLQNNGCDWLWVNGFDLNLPKADWQREFNFNSYDKIDKIWRNLDYYPNGEGYAIKGNYTHNVFNIESSRVTDIEIYISQEMVDLSIPVKVFINKKLMFNKIIIPNKNFMIDSFEKNFDRKALWVSSIKIHLQ